MTVINMAFPDPIKDYIDRKVTERGLHSPQEYVQQLVEEDQHRSIRKEVEEKLLQTLASPSRQMSDKDWQALEDKGLALIQARQTK